MISAVHSPWVYVPLPSNPKHLLTNSTGCRRRRLARNQRRKLPQIQSFTPFVTPIAVPQLTLRRTTYRLPHSHQSPRTRPRRQLRSLGRPLQHIRLRGQGHTQEGGSVERHHRGLLHRRLARSKRRHAIDAEWSHIVCNPACRYRGCRHWIQQDDSGEHTAR